MASMPPTFYSLNAWLQNGHNFSTYISANLDSLEMQSNEFNFMETQYHLVVKSVSKIGLCFPFRQRFSFQIQSFYNETRGPQSPCAHLLPHLDSLPCGSHVGL